jgi:dTDP-4-dehydrorhamnose reductase
VRIAVTGAGGLLAHAVLPALERAGHTAIALARRDADVTRLETLRPALEGARPDWVVHLAAFTRVDECESKADHAFLVNALGARNAALASLACGAGLLTISSDYVFDGTATAPYREYDAPGPRSVYGASKWAGEQAVREIQPRHLIVRSAWLYGPGGPNFVDTILARARAGEPLRVVDDQHGSPTYTHDLAAGLVRLLDAGQLGTFHCTNAGATSWYEVAVRAVQRAGLAVAIERTDTASFPRPARRPLYSVLDNQWFERATGAPLPPWQDALDRYLAAPAAARRS